MKEKLYDPDYRQDIGKSLFNEGLWNIVEYHPKHWQSVVSHDCPANKYSRLMVIRQRDMYKCLTCDAHVPDSILTLWTLQNWEELQRGN